MLCMGSPELGKTAGKGSLELEASGRGKQSVCQEIRLKKNESENQKQMSHVAQVQPWDVGATK